MRGDAPIQPLFIFSLSRSGSTLVQRVLGSYGEVATTSEPWILLPLLSMLHHRIPGQGDWQSLTSSGVSDFASKLPDGMAGFRRELKGLALDLYAGAAGEGPRYFLDKTPAYFLVVEEIVELFPEAKFIFLWRNPLSIIASIVTTWHKGQWEVDSHVVTLFDGIQMLLAAYEAHRNRVVAARYEDLVAADVTAWVPVLDYIGLEYDPASLGRFSHVQLTGRMGDQTGSREYASLSTEPLGKWKSTIDNPLRQAWCRRYLRWLGRERLAIMGYDLDQLLQDLESVPAGPARMLADSARMGQSLAREIARARFQRANSSSWRRLLASL